MINEEILEELKDFFAYYDDDNIIDNLEYFLYVRTSCFSSTEVRTLVN